MLELLHITNASMLLCTYVFSKLTSNTLPDKSVRSYSLNLLITAVSACVFFAISSGFLLPVNLPTFLFAVGFSLVVILTNVSALLMYKLTSIAGVSMIVNALSVIASSVLGIFLFGENLFLVDYIRIAVITTAILLIFFDSSISEKAENEQPPKTENEQPPKKNSLFLLIIVSFMSLVASCSSTLVMKFYSESTNVYSNDAFFFYTNVIVIVFTAIIFLFTSLRAPKDSPSLNMLKPKPLITIVLKTVFENIRALLIMVLMTMMNLAFYSALNSALGIITSVIASLLFKEKLRPLTIIAVALSFVTVFI